MSTSPCSVPGWLRALIPFETERQQAACRRHDERYGRGGDDRLRLIADLLFDLDLLGANPELLAMVEMQLLACPDDGAMPPKLAEQYLWGVRSYGGWPWPGSASMGGIIPMPPTQIEA